MMSGVFARNRLMSLRNLGLIQGNRVIQNAIGTAGERDVFAFDLAETAGVGHQIQLSLDQMAGDLDLMLYSASDNQLIQKSVTTNNREVIELAGLPAGSYRVEVSGYRRATGKYTLTLQTPQINHPADAFEAVGGNSFAAAEVLKINQTRIQRSIDTPEDWDYYQFDLRKPGLASHFLSLQFEASQGDLNLSLYAADQTLMTLPVQQSTGVPGNGQISLSGLSPGRYYARVNGLNGATNHYTLTLDAPRTRPDAWTVMTYITASDLEWYAPKNLEQMEAVMARLPNSVNFSALWDQSAAILAPDQSRFLLRYPTVGAGAWGDAGQAFLRPDRETQKAYPRLGAEAAISGSQAGVLRINARKVSVYSPDSTIRIASPFQQIGEQSTGKAAPLIQYLAWATQNAPATRNALVLWNHGGGPFGFNVDDSDGWPVSSMQTQTLVSALKTARRSGTSIDLLAFDECLMASVEVAYELRKLTQLLVASEELIDGNGYSYQTAFSVLRDRPDQVTPTDLARGLVRSYNRTYRAEEKQNTLSATRTDRLDELIAAIRRFTAATEQATQRDWQVIQTAQTQATQFDDESLRDLGKFVGYLQNQDQLSASIQAAAQAVEVALDQAVVAQTAASRSQTTGLSIFLPGSPDLYEARFKTYARQHSTFLRQTGWNHFLKQFLSQDVSTHQTPADGLLKEQSNGQSNGQSNSQSNGQSNRRLRSLGFSQNDQPEKAAPITADVLYRNLKLSPGTSDWFSFTTPRLATADQGVITVDLNNPGQKATVKLYGSDAETLLAQRTGRDQVQVKYANSVAIPYWIEVQAKGKPVSYALSLNARRWQSSKLLDGAEFPDSRLRHRALQDAVGSAPVEITPSGTHQFTLSSELTEQNHNPQFTLGLYAIETDRGGVRDPLTGHLLHPADAGYQAAALRSSQLHRSANTPEDQQQGFLPDRYAPFVQVRASDPALEPTIYFAYRGANSDRKSHFQSLGNQVWGFEADFSGPDHHFDDLLFRVKI